VTLLYVVMVNREVQRLRTMTTILFEGPHSRPKLLDVRA